MSGFIQAVARAYRRAGGTVEAIWAATSTAARALGRDDLGVIRPGAVADLLVVAADPLADIRSTLAIDRVVKGGRVFAPEQPLEHLPPDPKAATMAGYERMMAEFERLGR